MGLVVLDTSVLVAAGDENDALFEAVADALDARPDATYLVPAIVWTELLVGAFVAGRELEVRDQLRATFGDPRPVDEAVAVEAASLRARHRGLKTPDALVIATGVVDRVDEILTGDQRWSKVTRTVTVIKPARRRG